MDVGMLRRELAYVRPDGILAHTPIPVGGLPTSAARQTPPYDARPTTKTGGHSLAPVDRPVGVVVHHCGGA
jgi:hypothetical protein